MFHFQWLNLEMEISTKWKSTQTFPSNSISFQVEIKCEIQMFYASDPLYKYSIDIIYMYYRYIIVCNTSFASPTSCWTDLFGTMFCLNNIFSIINLSGKTIWNLSRMFLLLLLYQRISYNIRNRRKKIRKIREKKLIMMRMKMF